VINDLAGYWPLCLVKEGDLPGAAQVVDVLSKNQDLFIQVSYWRGMLKLEDREYLEALDLFKTVYSRWETIPIGQREGRGCLADLTWNYNLALLAYYRTLILLILGQLVLTALMATSTFDLYNDLSGGDLLSHFTIKRQDASGLLESGLELMKKKKYEKAHEKLARAAELESADPTIRFHLGRSLYRLERFDEAERLFEAIVKAEPGNKEGRYYYGVILNNFGRHEEALRELEEALRTAKGQIQYKPFDIVEVSRNKVEYRKIYGVLKGMAERLHNIEP
jgi:tetratricopeptide (TPR) repeat protein